MSVDEILREALPDLAYAKLSGGGLTVSGGEPLMQPAFTAALVKEAKKNGLHICLDTCGFGEAEQLTALAADVDLFLYDLKETDPVRHRRYTGVPLAPILENLRRLDALGAKFILRCPLIPGLNDRAEHWRNVGRLASELNGTLQLEIMPYHPLGVDKYDCLGRTPGFAGEIPAAAMLERCLHLASLSGNGRYPVKASGVRQRANQTATSFS